MHKRTFTCLVFFLLFFGSLTAQKLRVHVGLDAGMSQLFHGTRFETTTLRNLYETIAISHPDGYEWSQFEDDYQLRRSFAQPRFGFSAHFEYGDLPLFLITEALSSPSSYEKMAFAFTGGLGKDFFTYDSTYFFSFRAGYKFVYDTGFGSKTLVNSIGHREARQLIATYFNPKEPLGQQRGHLFTLRGGFGKPFGADKKMTLGAEVFTELDLTDKTTRESRMNAIGLLAYFRFRLL